MRRSNSAAQRAARGRGDESHDLIASTRLVTWLRRSTLLRLPDRATVCRHRIENTAPAADGGSRRGGTPASFARKFSGSSIALTLADSPRFVIRITAISSDLADIAPGAVVEDRAELSKGAVGGGAAA